MKKKNVSNEVKLQLRTLRKMLRVSLIKMRKLHFAFQIIRQLLVIKVYSDIALVPHRTKMSKWTLAASFSHLQD